VPVDRHGLIEVRLKSESNGVTWTNALNYVSSDPTPDAGSVRNFMGQVSDWWATTGGGGWVPSQLLPTKHVLIQIAALWYGLDSDDEAVDLFELLDILTEGTMDGAQMPLNNCLVVNFLTTKAGHHNGRIFLSGLPVLAVADPDNVNIEDEYAYHWEQAMRGASLFVVPHIFRPDTTFAQVVRHRVPFAGADDPNGYWSYIRGYSCQRRRWRSQRLRQPSGGPSTHPA
jgi:hypothetical protein